jgi:hypothetical protein
LSPAWHAPYRDERVDVTALRRVDWLVVLEDVVFAAAALVLTAATALVSTVAVAVALPNAAHPPMVPTIAAVAMADFIPATSCWRREVSVRAMGSLRLYAVGRFPTPPS